MSRVQGDVMKASYYIPSIGDDISDARGEFTIESDFNDADMSMVAEDAAKHEFEYCDGWEGILKDGEIEIALVVNGSDIGKVLVTVEYEPIYFGHKPFDKPGEWK
jgi:hypothetical protein